MKFKWLPVFNLESCIGCEACVTDCVPGSLTVIDGIVNFKNPEACLSDEYCVKGCPNEVIHMEWLPIDVSSCPGKLVDQKPA